MLPRERPASLRRTLHPPQSLDVRRLSHVARLAAVLVARFGLSLSLLKVNGEQRNSSFGQDLRQNALPSVVFRTAHVLYADSSELIILYLPVLIPVVLSNHPCVTSLDVPPPRCLRCAAPPSPQVVDWSSLSAKATLTWRVFLQQLLESCKTAGECVTM